MKVLIVANRVRTYALAFQNEIGPLLSLGHEIVWAADFSNFIGDRNAIPCRTFQIDIVSYPFRKTNLKALKQIKNIIREEKIEVVSSSTPIGGTLARIAAWQCGLKKNVIYAAHGFLFFKGVPFIKREIFRFHEAILARITDTLITITNEDYEAAKHFKMRGGTKPYLVHGAGVKIGLKPEKNREEMRRELGFASSDLLIVSAGDLNDNKNNQVVIRAMGGLPSNVHYLICGTGERSSYLSKLASELIVNDRVHFLGYRTDMKDIMGASDIFVMPSLREGIPRSILEAMDLCLPCVGSRTRGIADLIDENKGGYLCDPHSPDEFAIAFKKLIDNPKNCRDFGVYNQSKVENYSDEVVRSELTEIYSKVID